MNKKIKIFSIFVISIITLYIFTIVIVFILNKFDLLDKKEFINNTNNINPNNVVEIKDNSKYFSPFAPSFGNKNAKVSVVMFVDFDCPYCFQEYEDLKKIMNEYKDSVYFEFRNMPLETLHSKSNILANASMCANSQDKFWGMFDQVFLNYNKRQKIYENNDNDSELIKEIYNYGLNIGLDMNKFSECYDKNTFKNIINKDSVDGIKWGVNATPTFFINGKMISGAVSYENWKNIFDLSIEKSK